MFLGAFLWGLFEGTFCVIFLQDLFKGQNRLNKLLKYLNLLQMAKHG